MAEQDTEATSDKTFEQAFEELTRLDDEKPAAAAPEPQAAADPAAEPVAEAAPAAETPPETPETPAEGQGDDDDAAGEDEGDADEGKGAPQGVAADASREDEDLINRLGALLAKAKADPKPQPAAPAQPEVKEPAQEELISADDVKLIEEVEKDWPDVVKAVRAERNYAMRQAVDYVFKEVAKELKPLMQTVQTLAQRTHLQDLQSRVPDYNTVTDKVVAWVDKQPPYLQAAYKHVIQQGTAEEVADLIGRFRAEAGTRPATPASPQKKKAELPTATKQAVAALAPVSTKRSATASGGIDPSDFDGAFAAFANKVT